MNNSAFISYRRDVSGFIARAVFQNLRAYDFDVFMDVENIDSGQFDLVILNQIAARPYFLLILTPGTLDRCNEPGDWLRREIEHAMTLNRVIVPLITSSFSFAAAQEFLIEKLAELPRFNAVNVPHDYFDEAMERLRTRFLKPIDVATSVIPEQEKEIVQQKLEQAIAEMHVTQQQLSAQDYFEQAIVRAKENDVEGALADYSSAIRLDPNFAKAYCLRGNVYLAKGNFDAAIADYSKAIQLEAQFVDAYFKRGLAYRDKHDYHGAIENFNKVLQLRPTHPQAQYMRDRMIEWLTRL